MGDRYVFFEMFSKSNFECNALNQHFEYNALIQSRGKICEYYIGEVVKNASTSMPCLNVINAVTHSACGRCEIHDISKSNVVRRRSKFRLTTTIQNQGTRPAGSEEKDMPKKRK